MKKTFYMIYEWLCIFFSGMFDRSYYLQTYPDVRDAHVFPLLHYLRYGGFEGRNPSESFDSAGYLTNYPDVKQKGINPLVHYLRFGKSEGRNPKAPRTQYIPLKSSTINSLDSATLVFDHSLGGYKQISL